MFIIIIFTWDKTFLLRNRSSCGGICVCVCVLWGREKLLWQRCVKHQPRGGADIDGLSEIQQCGNRRRTNSFLMRSHLLSLPCLSLFFFLLLVLHTFWKAGQGQQNAGRLNTQKAGWIFSRWLPLPCVTITAIVPVVSWMCMYSEACHMCGTTTVWLCLEWINSQSLPSFCAFLCYLPLPVLFGHLLIRFACQCKNKNHPYMGKCPFIIHLRALLIAGLDTWNTAG